MIKLTDEEIVKAIDEANGGSEWRDGWEIQDVLEEQDKSIAKAQLKKVVEWADMPCECVPNGGRLGKQCPVCWQALLEETK